MNSDDGEILGDVGVVSSDFENEGLVSADVQEVSLDLNRGFDQIGRQKLESSVTETKMTAVGSVRVNVPRHVTVRN